MHGLLVDPDTAVDDVMRKWPQTVAVLLKYRMLCVGCPIGPFHTITDACREHRVSKLEFMADLQAAIRDVQ